MGDNDNTIHLKVLDHQPVFRIGLFNGQEHIDFRVMGRFSVRDENDHDLLKKIDSDLKWRVKIKESVPGKERYFLIVYEAFDRQVVEEKLARVKEIDESAEILVLGGDIYLEDRRVNNNTKYVIKVGSFATELEARKAFKRFQPDFIPYVEKEIVKAPQGQLEVFDAEYERSAEAAGVVRIVPEDINTQIKLYGVRSYDEILQREEFTDLVYNGIIEFRFDIHGQLMAISEIPLEPYLKRVIYSEIGTDLPLEFAKSLAIVCRSEALARVNHNCLGEPYDYDTSGKTLRYVGKEFSDENIDRAVELTAGQVIFSKSCVRDTPFHLICGGHTEDDPGMAANGSAPFFKGKFDGKESLKEFGDLQLEPNVRKWIHARPETWCNLRGREIPESLEQGKRYFRWEVNYSRRELEEILRRKTGEDIGILFEIIPLVRGCSGRLKEIELIGSLKNYRIRGELNIREALAYDYLPSSCFLVERELDETGTPISFTFVGAGQGHGMGMCKIGGVVMAMEGYDSNAILEHYFESCRIQSIYEIDLDKREE
ncbi:MAG: SpoIID/LytB domain-containing protein [Calditrichaeota bacterium]|nr:MAG: SpoIID/LytB domain-containing protein [Calditrichota bacterium]